ncbi:MAG: Rpn family recombination-promoting nuclease/putative transposase [Ruminococcus sp.]|nr:Rpn family recombination-promoting nuclease/putative transposase [Ruminococcus sp.]
MADKDTVTKNYMQDRETFADVFNFLIYGGEQVISPEQLKPLDTAAVALPYGEDSKTVPVQKYRDVLKMVTAMEDDNAAYLLLGIENQFQVHYAMPVRNMLYDALQYVNQVDEAAKSHKAGSKISETRAEFLSGFYGTDKLLPVITLTIYFGAEEWTAPKSLYDMFSETNDRLLSFVPDYKLNLIAPAEIADEDFAKFHTELSLALKYVKYSKDKKKLREMLREDAAYKNVSRKTADMINIVTNSGLRYNAGEENVDMCEAIEGIRNDARAEGIKEGISRGIEKGIEKGFEKGIKQGIEDGIEKGVLKTLIGLVKDGILTIADAAKRANMTVSEFENKTGLK